MHNVIVFTRSCEKKRFQEPESCLVVQWDADNIGQIWDFEFIDFEREYKRGVCACLGSILVSGLVIYFVAAMKKISNK